MLPDIVREAARRFGDAPAYVEVSAEGEPGASVSYADLDRRSDAVAAGLARRGVRSGEVVAIALPPGLAYPICYVAAAKIGAVTAGVNTRLPPERRAELAERVAARVVIGEDGEDPASLELSGVTLPRLPAVPDRPVAIVFTSGTTGRPRGAVFCERQLEAITQIDGGGSWGGGSRSLFSISFAHLGFMTRMPGALRRGGTVFIQKRWDAGGTLALTQRLQLPTLAGVPTQVALVLRHPSLSHTDLTSLRMVVMGGAPATGALVREACATFGVPVVVRYASTEGGIGTGTTADDPPEAAEETVGRPHPGVEVAIRADPDGSDLPHGEVGEVLLRSAAAMARYWDDPEATADVMTADGFVRTGDLGLLDGDGRLRLTGRSSDRYIRGGYNVSPLVVEQALATHPDLADIAVIAVADDVFGEVGAAVIVARPDRPVPTLEDLRDFGADRLAAHELPERLVVMEQLPLTPGDKVDREALRASIESSGRGA